MVWVKRLAILVGVLIALMIAAVAYVMIFVNPNDFKGEIQKVALQKADIHLRMDGDIHWSFFPRFGLTLNGIGVAMGDKPEILQFDRAEFGLAILPLLKRSIEVDTVELVNLKANLSVDKNGRGNWQQEVPKATSPQSASAASNNTANNSSSASSNGGNGQVASASSAPDPLKRALPDLHLDKLIIKNAHINYQNAAKNQKIKAVVNLDLSNVQWDKAWPMAMNLAVTQSDLQGNHPLSAQMKLDSDLTVFPSRQAFSLSHVDLSTSASGDQLPISPLKATLKAAQVDMDVPQETLSVNGISLNTLGVSVNANLKSYQVLSDPEYNASLSVAEFNPRDVMKHLNIALPKMADDKALTSAKANVTVQGNKDTVMVKPLSVVLDGNAINATAGINLSPLSWDVNVAGSNINLDHYLPPESTDKEAKVPSKVAATTSSNDNKAPATSGEKVAASTTASGLIPVDLIRSLEGHVGVTFKNIILKKMKLDKVALDATAANGLVRISPAIVNLYQGKAEVKASLDVRGKTPKMKVVPQISDVQIQPLLQDYMDMNKLRGTTFLNGELVAQGNQVDTLMSSLQGDLLVNVKKGALVGVNVTKTVCQGIAAVRKESINDKSFGPDTPFDSLSFPAHIVNGQISTPGLKISSAGVQVTGDGVISLPKQSLDYQANVSVAGSNLDHACRVNDKVAKLAFPIVCKGNFSDDPSGLCRPDLKKFGGIFADMAKQELKVKADAEKARLKDKLKEKREKESDKLKDKLKDKLNNLF